jgi:hypothetical protein
MSAVAASKAVIPELAVEAAGAQYVAGADVFAVHTTWTSAADVAGGALFTGNRAVGTDDDRAGRGVRAVVNAVFATLRVAELGLAAAKQAVATAGHVAGGTVVAGEIASVVTGEIAGAGEVLARRNTCVIVRAWDVAVVAASANTFVSVAHD